MINRRKREKHGYAVVLVMILMIIGAGIILLSNKENILFTKLTGMFNRSKKIQAIAESGMQLAELDLKTLSRNVLAADYSNLDVFTNIPGESAQLPINQGLHVWNVNPGNRIITPRISQLYGDIQLEVYYFPENPCENVCSESEYNEKVPKFFTIVSQATNTNLNQVYTTESRIQVRLENFSEISYGVLGVTDYPVVNSAQRYFFAPSIYGRTHFKIPQNRIRFTNNGYLTGGGAEPQYIGPSNTNTFLGPVTFEYDNEYDYYGDEDLPFQRSTVTLTNYTNVALKPTMEFTKGLEYPVDLVAEPEDDSGNPNPDYDPYKDPSTEEYFTELAATANSVGGGINLSGTVSDCRTNSVSGNYEQNICLKMVGDELHEYACNNIDPDSGEFFMKPNIDNVSRADDFDPSTTPATLHDRYVGERSDVTNGTTANVLQTHTLDGVIYCRNSSCDCNLHIKGVYGANATFAADNIVIEGDIVNNDQDPINSPYTFGAIAKKNLVLPPGIPQGANSHPWSGWESERFLSHLVANDPPFENCTTPSAPCNPNSLAETYLGITNFIAHDGTEYIDRDIGNETYLQATPWIDHGVAGHSENYYNSPSALDLDGHFYAGGTFKIEGIFNPEVSPDGDRGMGILTCENPPTCTDYKYREPEEALNDDGTLNSNNPLYVDDPSAPYGYSYIDGAYGDPVEPVFWADGLDLPWQNFIEIDDIDGGVQPLEEVPRMKNSLLHVFGSINARYFHSVVKKVNFEVGFRTKVINNDPRAGRVNPPSFPYTLNVLYDELYTKSYAGKSKLLP